MSLHAIAGLAGLNLLVLGAGAGVLWTVRGWASWADAARLCGVAYMLGLAVVGCLLVLELVAGIPFGLVAILLTTLGTALLGLLGGWKLGRRAPARPHLRAAGADRPVVVSALGVAGAVLLLEALFRKARIAGLFEWDAMAFWVPKAKAIYFLHGLDEQFFTSLPGASYPPLVPALEASGFTFMGADDAVTLHLLPWFALAGFLAATAGLLLQRRVSPAIVWPCVLLVAVTPRVVASALDPGADMLLDYFVSLAALLLALWLLERERWQIVLAGVFLAAAMLTKREGALLAACLSIAACAASWRERRRIWPIVAATAALAFAVSVPWRVWFRVRGIGGEGAEAGGLGLFDHLDRVWPSLELTLRVAFDPARWLVVLPLALVAMAMAALAGASVLSRFAGAFTVLAIGGFTWVIWAFPSIPVTANASLNPIVRLTGGLVLVFAGLLPLLLHVAWLGREKGGGG